MNTGKAKEYSYLDTIRIEEGVGACKEALAKISRKDARHAVSLLDDERLMFPSLYILHDDILKLRLQGYLNQRNRSAIEIINAIKGATPSETAMLSTRQDAAYLVLKWILETGFIQEIPENAYEEIVDVCAAVLVDLYRDMSILPYLVVLIFKRNRNGRYIHDLVWALFRLADPKVLRQIAVYLRSANAKDRALATELLNLEEGDIAVYKGDGEGRYAAYLQWLNENEPYLYFTGESFQYATKPAFSTVDLGRKYLQKAIASYETESAAKESHLLSNEEQESLAVFRQLSLEEQKMLSGYSQQISAKSVPAWKAWLQRPVKEQIKAAQAGLEGEE